MEEEITLLSSSSSSTSSSSSSLSIETCYHHDDSELVRLRRYSNDFLRSIPPRPHTLTFGAYESMEMMKHDDSRDSETRSECKMETNEKDSEVELSEVIKDNQGQQLITIKTEDEQVESSVEIECNQEPVQSEMVKIGCINDQRSVKIKVNDLTPSSSQEFLGPAVGGRRSPGTPSSLASSTCSSPQASPVSTPCKSPTPVDPSVSSHSTSTSITTTAGSTTTTIGGTTAKRCAKRNSNSGLPGSTNNLKQSNYTVNNNSLNYSKESREMVSDPIIRRKSWSSSIDQAGLGQNELDHFIGDAPHRVVSLSSLDSDIEETFYDARESDSPKRKMTQAKPSEQPSSNNNSNHKKTIFTLTRYSSISASRLDDIVNSIDDPSEGGDKLRLKATGLTVSFEDLTLSESSDHKESQNNSTVNLQFDKPRSLSASSSEAIFNLNHHQSSSSPSQCNHANAPMVQSARSMSDIINVKPSLDDFSSMKSESNSSSRESISPSSTVSGNLTSKRLMATSATPSTPLTSSKSSSSVKKVEPVTSPSTVTTSKATPTTIISPSHYYHHQYLTPPRSTLHKSISTPSILTAQEAVEEQSTPHERRDKNLSYISNQESDDEKSISKRKKRGSLFFRKKRKDKEVKKVSPHQFVSVCYSIAALCDVCKKALANKPAIKCENCMVTVHDSSCKDQILDCNKFRLAKKPSHLALTTKDRTISPMLQVPPGSNAKSSSPTSSVKEKKLVGFSKNHQSSSTLDTQGITCKPPSSSSPSKVICEDKELDTGEDGHSNIVETASGSMESLDEGVAEVITSEFEDDCALRLLDDEPESWNNTVDKKVLKRLKEKDIRRQEVIHELIITEKHHCLTLKIMQKIYAQGMIKELHMTKDMVERIFPCLEDLLETHLTFLKKLRERQSLDSVIDNIGDIILQQFSGSNGEQLRNCYGQFCSQHKEALSLYKDILKTDRKFQNFIKKCSMKPVCKTRGIPECILLVTQRITKYPLLIDSLLKVTKDNKCDYSDLKDALSHCKNVINRVDAQVAEKEKEIRLLEIYNKIDAKSTTIYKGKKFRKSDLLSNNRKLRHEAVLSWKSARSKVVDVIGVILSDVIILLQENNQKYHFCSLDNKSSVVSLQKLLVREKAGQLSRGVYLISSNPHEPEMYELICPTAKEQKNLIDQIREAVEICPDEEEDCPNEGEEKKIEEARKAKVRELLNSMYEKDARMAQMCEDKMKIFADMMELLGIEQEGIELIRYVPMIEDNCSPETIINAANEAFRIAHNLYVSGTNLCRSVSSAGEHQSDTFVSPILPKRAETFGGFDNPEKDPLLRLNALKKKLGQLKDCPFKENVTGDSRPSEVDPDGSALNMGSTLSTASSSSSSTTTMTQGPTNESFLAIRPTLTDHRRSSGPLVNKCSSNASSPEKTQRRSLVTTPTPSIQSLFASSSTTLAPISPSSSTSSSSSMFATLPLYDPSDIYRLTTTPLLMTQGKDQLIQIAELQHQVNLLMCLFNYQQTLFENMRFQLMDSNNKIIQLQKDNIYGGNNGRDAKSDRRSVYRPEQGLEELRNLQEQLRMEKSEWIKKLNEEKTGIESERKSLEDLQEKVRKEQKDVEEQREMLYRKLEALQKEGIILSPAHTIVNTGNLRINPDLVNRGNGLNNNSLVSNNSNNNNNSPCNATGISDCDRLTGSSCNQFTRSVATNFNNISFPSCLSSTPGTTVSSETPSLTSSDKVNQSSSSAPRTPSLAFNSGSNSSPIKQQLPLKLAVNESGQGRCNHSQVVNSPSNQQIPATIGNIPYQTQ